MSAAVYVVKWGNLYATGGRSWTRHQWGAFRFSRGNPMWRDVHRDPRDWARGHAATFNGKKVRVVRLVARKKAA